MKKIALVIATITLTQVSAAFASRDVNSTNTNINCQHRVGVGLFDSTKGEIKNTASSSAKTTRGSAVR